MVRGKLVARFILKYFDWFWLFIYLGIVSGMVFYIWRYYHYDALPLAILFGLTFGTMGTGILFMMVDSLFLKEYFKRNGIKHW